MRAFIKYQFLYIVFSALIFTSCKTEPEKTEALKAVKSDSLLLQLNSPELKAVNAKLLNDPNNAALFNERAKIYIALRQWDEGIGDALRAMNLDSTKAEYYVTLADVYFASNKTRYAKETLELTIKKFPEDTEALLKLAELYYLVKQYENAFTFINKALKLDENIAKAYYLKGTVYKEIGDTAKAISSMQTAIEQDNTYYSAFLDIGILYSGRKNPLAFEYFNNALKLQPNSQEALYAQAKLLQDLNKLTECIAAYEKLLAINKDHIHTLYNLGAIYFDKKDDVNKAIDYFSKAIAVDPKYTEAYFARGYCFQKLKDYNNAKADYNMCLQLTPNYEPAIQELNTLGK